MTKNMSVECGWKRRRGRPNKRWFEVIKQCDMRMTGIREGDAKDRSKWKFWIRVADPK